MSYNVEGRFLYEANKCARESIKNLTYDELAQRYIDLVMEMIIYERDTRQYFRRVENIVVPDSEEE